MIPARLPAGFALVTAGAVLLSGCAAAVIAAPLAAGAGVLKAGSQDRPSRRQRAQTQAAPKPGQVLTAADGSKVQVTALTALPPPDGAPAAPAAPGNAPPGMQYLYGSGEAAALSMQAYQALWNYLRTEIGYRRDKTQVRSVVLAPGSTLDNPRFETCGKRPHAVVLDIDETALLNLGYERDEATRGGAYDAARWSRWEQTGADKVAAVPGAAEALAAARREGFTVIFNSNRSAASAAQTAAALEHAGLGPAALFDTLWLRGEGETSGKDSRRQKIAQRYCVVAMAGDQLGDFSDLFNAPEAPVATRRNSVGGTLLAPLWGAGWFMLPNPVYGTGLKGGVDEIFPPDARWTDPGQGAKP
ncbi:HAD family acid phosphatase [Sphingomonas sp. DG1-23]|uniref:HAD family acid phosphatase n=1 Tax=Sphingomonas sp. DG1-23 TaxID=3068316 RepID=UPI00273DB3C2|nr:HAD family acid phosphatase [Sphingomonas sp. DG1-23]MDP5279127.1 HAD family acid phosphatase [Sphingomonas sp. DG1-23]